MCHYSSAVISGQSCLFFIQSRRFEETSGRVTSTGEKAKAATNKAHPGRYNTAKLFCLNWFILKLGKLLLRLDLSNLMNLHPQKLLHSDYVHI